ncbi:activating signal cointegrator 1 [Anabrus simplex]|uniref:activating signal cointegrator 1 n=1 Tax=Anabrus simplex TaxID=316456 RepID=UPI0035A2EF00
MANQKDSLLKWIDGRLSKLLDFPVPQDLTEYILAIENSRDLEDYLKTLLDFSNPQHSQFFQELLQKRQEYLGTTSEFQAYKKSEVEESYILPKQNEKKRKGKGQVQAPAQANIDIISVQKENKEPQEKKKKSKFVNLYSQEGQMKDVVLLKGRHHCDCQASKHKLVNNCLKCGRIVCEQEGSGPCLFCNNLVCSREEQQMLATSSKQATALYQKLVNQKKPEGWESAIEQRNRLLEYDRTSEKRTKVIDDESDYFAINSVWLSKAEREKLKHREEEIQAKRHASRLDRKVTLDFAGRQVIEEPEEDLYSTEAIESVLKEIENDIDKPSRHIPEDSNVNPEIIYEAPIFQESANNVFPAKFRSNKDDDQFLRGLHSRIQDREYLEMSDEGFCLSMDQPWASLLVRGIKVHEGRTWYTAHRGRLWIASTAKTPVQEEIREIEHVYRVLKNDEGLKFPEHYPSGCLLGCVSMIDCLPQEEYRLKFPEGESQSPFVFICEDARELPIRFPIKGKHKIYKLDQKIHQAAQKSLERIARIIAERIRGQ